MAQKSDAINERLFIEHSSEEQAFDQELRKKENQEDEAWAIWNSKLSLKCFKHLHRLRAIWPWDSLLGTFYL